MITNGEFCDIIFLNYSVLREHKFEFDVEVVIMGKAIITFVLTLIIGALAEATVGTMFNMPGIGAIVAIAVAGACTVYFTTKKER